jgi:hypothetical protein
MTVAPATDAPVTAAPVTAAPLRVGVIGVGVMGTDHAERLSQRVAGATLVAVADPDVGRAEAVAARLGSVRAYADPLDLVADDAVDAVVVASPGAFHEEQVVACIEAGTYVLCEKPLTLDARRRCGWSGPSEPRGGDSCRSGSCAGSTPSTPRSPAARLRRARPAAAGSPRASQQGRP